MMLRKKVPELLLAALALAGVAALFFPLSPAPLPARRQGTAVMAAAASPAQAAKDPAPAPSVAEAASLFIAHRAAPALPPQKKTAAPEMAPWLHFIAYVVSSSGQTVYFFKNDQTGRVFMLAYNQPHDGWNLASIQGDAYILEKEDHRYTVMKK
jgi:hypothetical protein